MQNQSSQQILKLAALRVGSIRQQHQGFVRVYAARKPGTEAGIRGQPFTCVVISSAWAPSSARGKPRCAGREKRYTNGVLIA